MKSHPMKGKPSAKTATTQQKKILSKVSLADNRKSSNSGLVQMASQGKQALQLKALEDLFNSPQPIQKKEKRNFEGIIIQRHPLDDAVLGTNSLEEVVSRIEGIANGEIMEGPIQKRINDLWIKQNTLLNKLRAQLEFESAQDDSSVEAIRFSEEVSNFTIRITKAKLNLFSIGINTPKVMAYKSLVGEILPGGGGGYESE